MKKLLLLLTVISSLVTNTAQAETTFIDENYHCGLAQADAIQAKDPVEMDLFAKQYSAAFQKMEEAKKGLTEFAVKYGVTYETLVEETYDFHKRAKYKGDRSDIGHELVNLIYAENRLLSYQRCRLAWPE